MLGYARIFLWSMIAGLVAALTQPAVLAAQPADLVLLNGRIVTLDQRSTVAEAIAIRGERIAALGSSAAIQTLVVPATRTIDLAGRTVIPGLIDSHIHAIRAGHRYATEVSWTGARTLAEALERVRSAARQASAGSWLVVAGGWTPQQFAEGRRPTQAELMKVAPDHPVYVQLFYRAALLTAKALEALAIRTDVDIPPQGRLERSADGSKTGWLAGDSATITALYNRLPKPSLADGVEGTRRYFSELNRYGLTGVIDPGGHNLAPEDYEALFRLWRRGGLTLRVAYSVFAPRRGQELEDFRQLTRFLPMGTGDDMLRFNGIGECVTWGMYNNDTPTQAQKDEFFLVALWAAERGMTVTAHWNNNRSVHHLLEVLERVNRVVPVRDLRWSIAHLHDASDSSLARMKALGVGWLMQDGLHFAVPSFIAERGRGGMARMPPIVSASRLGLPIGGGTDANRVMSHNPFVSLRWMLDGLTVDGIATREAAEIPSREAALRIYTAGSAWFAHDEARRGTLEAGKLADLAVLSADYFSVPLNEIGRIESLLTMVGGRVVYAAEAYAGMK